MSIAFACEHCGKQYEVDAELTGRRARCSRCQTVFRVPEPAAVLASATDDEYRLAALFDEEFGPTPDTEHGATRPCPACATPLSTEAILCIQCGYHLEKEKKIGPDKEATASDSAVKNGTAKSSASAVRRKQQRGPQGFPFASYVRGSILSLLFALTAGGLWAAASLSTDYALGFFAWPVGGLAGLGMALAHRDDDGLLAGLTSAFMALVGCVFSKVLYFAFFFSAFTGAIGDHSREYVASIVAEESIRSTGEDPEQVDEVYFDQQVGLAMQTVADWSTAEIGERIALYNNADRGEATARLLAQQQHTEHAGKPLGAEAYAAIYDQVNRMSDAEVVAVLEKTPAVSDHVTGESNAAAETEAVPVAQSTNIMSMLFLSLLAFGIFGGIFLVLGMVSAYRIGSGNLVT